MLGFLPIYQLPSGGKISWGEVEAVIQIESEIEASLKQAATYSLCSLLNERRRSFAIVIGFDQNALDAYFFVFHRLGLSSSRPLCLRTQQGLEGVMKHIIGMLCIQDEAGYGLDMTRSHKMFHINERRYRIVRLIYTHDTLCGRSTAVYSLNGMSFCLLFSMQSLLGNASGKHHQHFCPCHAIPNINTQQGCNCVT